MLRIAAVVALLARASPAQADEWHVGLNLRPELAVRPVRIGGGLRLGAIDLAAVVDPVFWIDGIADSDLVAAWWFPAGFSIVSGWRPTAVDLGDGYQWQHRLLVGAAAALPELPIGLRAHAGFEIALLLLKHGGGLPSDGLSFDRSAADHVSMGAFLQVDYAWPR
jgi:hypothetical protein